jgi:hypothetical protein
MTTHGLSGAACEPTASPSCQVDLSLPATPGASVVGSLRIEPCMCGLAIIAPVDANGFEQVLAHNQGRQHQEYRERFGL